MAETGTGTATRKSGPAARLAGALRHLRLAVALCLFAMLGGCAVPPAVSVATYVGDGLLLLGTGKSSTDLGISIATGRDCSTFRIFGDEDVCQDAVVARAEPIPTEILRDDAAAAAATSASRGRDGAALAMAALDEAFQPLAAGERAGVRAQARTEVMLAALPQPLPEQAPHAIAAASSRFAAGPPPPRPAAAIVKVAAAASALAVKTSVKRTIKPKAVSLDARAKAAPPAGKQVRAAAKKSDKAVSSKVASAKKRKVAAKKKRTQVASAGKRKRVAAKRSRGAKVAALAMVPPARPAFEPQAAKPIADLVPAPATSLRIPDARTQGTSLWRPFPPPPTAMGERSRWSADRLFSPPVRSAPSLQIAALARP